VTDGDYTRNGFEISSVVGSNGHFVSSLNVVNIHGNDSVYIRVPSLGSNGFETLSGTKTNVMAKIATSADDNGITFHQPTHPFSVNIGRRAVSDLQILITDADGKEVNFQGVEHEMAFLFECYNDGTRKNGVNDPDWYQRKQVHSGGGLLAKSYTSSLPKQGGNNTHPRYSSHQKSKPPPATKISYTPPPNTK
jgi:hypothetical protein